MMGSGKTAIGRRLAQAIGASFQDADQEIERAACLTVSEIFSIHGEAEFRRGERLVIARLLEDPPHVLATGGGAFAQADTRDLLNAKAITIWLRAEVDVLLRRVKRREDRPLLRAPDPRAVLEKLLREREPLYAQAQIVIDSKDGPQDQIVQSILDQLDARQWQ